MPTPPPDTPHLSRETVGSRVRRLHTPPSACRAPPPADGVGHGERLRRRHRCHTAAATMVDPVDLLPGGTLDTALLNSTATTLAEGINTNAASMDVFFVLFSGYLVFLMQTVRAGTRFSEGGRGGG